MWTDTFPLTRRSLLARSAFGIGAFALAHLLREDGLLANSERPGENLPPDLKPRAPHFAPRARAMISLFMHGGPSHVDLFDPKPELKRHHGKDYAGEIAYSFVNQASKRLFGSPWRFVRHGRCGTEVSELLPHTAGIVDDICVVRSMHTEAINHEPAITYIQTGNQIAGRPCLGAWVAYGLGSMNQNLPTFVVLHATHSDPRANVQAISGKLWSAGFLSAEYAGVALRSS